MVGTSGLEPPTSRLSGVRSNHLSYAPIFFFPPRTLCGHTTLLTVRIRSLSVGFCTHIGSLDLARNGLRVLPNALAFRRGGDEEDRTPDPLLAKQVLSQLSYTPVQGIRFHSIPLRVPFEEPQN